MPEPIELMTERLRLRQWKTGDREPFAAMNADPEVMRYFASVGTLESSNRTIDVWQSEIEERGWSNWAVEHIESVAFVGFVGLSVPRRALPFMPCVEIRELVFTKIPFIMSSSCTNGVAAHEDNHTGTQRRVYRDGGFDWAAG